MTALFFRGSHTAGGERPEIEPLTPANVRNLRLPWLSRFNATLLASHLAEHEGHALWVPSTGEYIVAEPWRSRRDIASLMEVSARKGRDELVRALLVQLGGQGYRLALCSDEVWRDHPKMWLAAGFGEVERIVFFQRDLHAKAIGEPLAGLPELEYRQLTSMDLDTLVYLDHDAFPWLWWNSREEFEAYIRINNVFVYAAYAQDGPVGYASFTLYDGWSHLDRLAVTSAWQGRRYGAAQLLHVMQQMAALGSLSVHLSTQQTNVRSHRLYKAFGFKQLSETMTFYGKDLSSE